MVVVGVVVVVVVMEEVAMEGAGVLRLVVVSLLSEVVGVAPSVGVAVPLLEVVGVGVLLLGEVVVVAGVSESFGVWVDSRSYPTEYHVHLLAGPVSFRALNRE